jgi:CheY-like chemotaxis protein
MDMGMPEWGGTGFLDRVTNPDGTTLVPVLVLTARASMAEYFADKHIAGFIAKPCDPSDRLREVGRILFMTATDGSHASPAPSARRGVIAEGDDDRAHRLMAEFIGGRDSMPRRSPTVPSARGLRDIQARAVVMRLELEGMSARRGGGHAQTVAAHAGNARRGLWMDPARAQLEHVANLNIPQTCMLKI